jgi:hypothetical protein
LIDRGGFFVIVFDVISQVRIWRWYSAGSLRQNYFVPLKQEFGIAVGAMAKIQLFAIEFGLSTYGIISSK